MTSTTLLFVPDLAAQFLEHRLQSTRATRIMEHRQIDVARHNLADRHVLASARSRDQLLCQGGGCCRYHNASCARGTSPAFPALELSAIQTSVRRASTLRRRLSNMRHGFPYQRPLSFADYARAGFGRTLAFGRRPVLLLVDLVAAYVRQESALYAPAFELALESAARVAAAARAAAIPVVFTRVAYSENGQDGGIFFRKVPALRVFAGDSALGAFEARLKPLPGELIVTKQYASAFFGTSLSATLTTMGCDTVMLAGFSTSGCVRATALDAMQHGFIPYVVREACGDRDERPHEASLFDLQAKYAEVVDEQYAIRLLARD